MELFLYAPDPVLVLDPLLLLPLLPAALAPRTSANVAVLKLLSLTTTSVATATVYVRRPTG